jgi:flagellar motor switch protein FliM
MDPKEIISPEESDALRQPAPPADVTAARGATPAGQVTDLHADHWERILADRVPALESIAERMVSLLKVSARRFFRRSVDITVQPTRSMRWGSFARALPVPTSLNVLDIKPLNLKGLIALDAGFVFVLVDVFFGGDGKNQRDSARPEFTPMEQRLTRKFIEAIAIDLKEAWKPFVDLEFVLGKSETNPIFAAVAAPSDTVTLWRVVFARDELEHVMELVLPATLVETIRSLGESSQADTSQNNAQKWHRRLREDVQEARVTLRAVLAGSEITLRDIATAQPGDVIPLDLPATITLCAGEQPLVEGTFGICQGRNAVRISKPVNRRMLGETYGRTENQ